MMRMRHRDGERIGGIVGGRVGFGQQHADHHPHLALVAVAGADDALLHQVRRIFGDRHAGSGRHHHGDAARLAELERRLGVLVDEGRLDRRLVRPEFFENAHQPVMDGEKPRGERVPIVGRHRAAADKAEPIAGNLDHAPAGAAEPRIDAENANRAASCPMTIAPPARDFDRGHAAATKIDDPEAAPGISDRRETTGADNRTISRSVATVGCSGVCRWRHRLAADRLRRRRRHELLGAGTSAVFPPFRNHRVGR